jgi:hypothetical protein
MLGFLMVMSSTVGAIDATERVTVMTTFESASVYIDAAEGVAQVDMAYRRHGTHDWRKAFPPVHMPSEDQFRGSIVSLEEGTTYDLQVTLHAGDATSEVHETSFTTWSGQPGVSRVVRIDEVYSGGKLVLDRWIGEEDGWIKILGNGTTVIDGEYLPDEAVVVTNSRYLILENLIVRGGRRHGINITNSEHVWVVNCDIAGYGRLGDQNPETGQYHDDRGSVINYDAGIRIWDAGRIVVERNYIHDPRNTANAWAGPTWESSHPTGPEAMYVHSRLGGGGIVVRYNDFIGSDDHRWNDAIEGGCNGCDDGSFSRDSDIYGNLFLYGNDDGIELDGGQMNVRFFGNRIEGFLCGISTAPNRLGPSYIYRNLIANLGDETGAVGSAVKNGGGYEHSRGRHFFFHNTMYGKGHGINAVGFGNEPSPDRGRYLATSRNNVLVSSEARRYSLSDGLGLKENDFDFDLIGNTAAPDGQGRVNAVSGSEAHGISGVPALEGQAYGDFRPKPGSLGVDAGQVLANFSDTYSGVAPDMGAFESGQSAMMPWRPLDAKIDKQRVKVWDGSPEVVTLQVGALSGGEQGFTIKKNDTFDWLQVEPASGILTSDAATTFTVSVDPAKMTRALENGAFIIKLEDGHSVPVVVRGSSAHWDIDQRPTGYVRYRVSPGTPVALYLQAFSPTEEDLRAYVAVSPAVALDQALPRAGQCALIDDGEWHHLFFDVRVIREVYPDAKVLYGPRLQAVTRVDREYYDMDEAAALSDEMLAEATWADRLQSRQKWHVNIGWPQKWILSGEVPVDVRIERYADVTMREFSVEMDGRVICSGTDAPPANSCSIDTYQFGDGQYELVVRATDEDGQSITQSRGFSVRNRGKLTDHFDPPMEGGWFGVLDRRKTALESEGWAYTDAPESLFGDASRMVRKADTAEYLVWDTPILREFAITIYSRTQDVASSVDLAVTADGERWLSVPYDVEVSDSSPDGWYKLILSGHGPEDIESMHFRLALHDYAPAEHLQTGQAVFGIRL